MLLSPILNVAAQGSGPVNTSGGSGPVNSGTPFTQKIEITNPFKGGNDLYAFIKTVIDKVLMPIGGVIAVIMIMYAGFTYVTAGGDPGKIKTANQMLLYTAIGAAILLGAWVISDAIQGTVNQLRA